MNHHSQALLGGAQLRRGNKYILGVGGLYFLLGSFLTLDSHAGAGSGAEEREGRQACERLVVPMIEMGKPVLEEPQAQVPLPASVPASFQDSKKQAQEYIRARGAVLGMSSSRVEAVIALTEEAENQKYLDPSLALLVYQTSPEKVTTEMVAGKFFSLYIDAELALQNDNSFGSRARRVGGAVRRRTVAIGGSIAAGVFLGFVAGISNHATSPIAEPLSAEWRTWVFRAFPVLQNKDSASEGGEKSDYAQMYDEIWANVNRTVSLTQREGRSYFYEAISISFQVETAYQLLQSMKPEAGSAEMVSWRRSLNMLKHTLEDMPVLYPDFYDTNYGRSMKAHQDQLLKDMESQ